MVERAGKDGDSGGHGDIAARVWPIHMGFHAVPSMNTVHMHVISSDLVAEKLRHKKVSCCISRRHRAMPR